MELLNKIEIRGIVGQVSFAEVGDKKHANFSVCTQYAYKNQSGEAVVETTWFNVSAWEGPKNGIDNLQKGAQVFVSGRIRTRYYEGNGCERILQEVEAQEVRVEPKSEEA